MNELSSFGRTQCWETFKNSCVKKKIRKVDDFVSTANFMKKHLLNISSLTTCISQISNIIGFKTRKNHVEQEKNLFGLFVTGKGVSEKVLAVGFCLGSGLFGSCNSD